MAKSSKLDLLKNDIPYSWLNFFKISCTQCLQEFSGFEKENSHRPILLHCSHIVCEYCLGRAPLKFYKCRKCNEITYFDVARDLRLQTTFNQYLDGILTYKKHTIPYRENFLSKIKQSITVSNNKEECCYECNSKVSLKFCLTCCVIYCNSCFTSIHRSAKALNNHRFNILDKSDKNNLDTIPSICKIHSNEKFMLYCQDCGEICCKKCINDDHPNHQLISIWEENIKHKHLVEDIIGLISTAQKENETSKLLLENFYRSHDKHLTDAVEQITNHFIYLHGLLQNIEFKYISTIKKSYKVILEEINITESILSENEIFLSKKCDKLHSLKAEMPKHEYILPELKETEKSICNLPVTGNFQSLSINPISFKEVKLLKDELTSYFKLDIQTNIYKQFAKNNLISINRTMCDTPQNEGHSGEETEGSILTITNTTLTNNPHISLTTNILNQHFNKQKLTNNSKMYVKSKQKVTTELVHVSHIESATHFYVQKQTFFIKIAELKEMCNAEGISALAADKIELNEMYLVYKPNENVYFRAIVTNCSETNVFFTVFYIDYGTTEKNVKTKRFRIVSQYLRNIAKAVRLCSLYNVQCNNKKISEQVQLMSDIIRDQQMTMITLYEKNDINYVDLFNNTENRISLRDALLFCDVITGNVTHNTTAAEKILNLEDYKREFIYSKSSKKIFNNVVKIGEYFKICIKHIVSPGEFYVMKADHVEMIINMNQKLNEVCSKSSNFIYYPQMLTNCAVYGHHDVWHRGLITKILPNKLIEVKLIDLGIKQLVLRQNLMYLDESFCTISEGVIKCQLSDVQPKKKDNYEFTEDIIEKFKEFSLSSNLHLNINKIVKGNIVVILHILQANQDICVNELLKGNDNSNCQSNLSKYSAISMKNISVVFKSDRNPKEVIKDKQGIKRTKINILNIISPSEIYICLDNFLPGLKKLHINIQKYMETIKNDIKTKPNWNQYEKCFVNSKLDKNFKRQWYRGIIKSIDKIDQNKFVIFLRDKGCFVTEHYNLITETNDLLGNIGSGSIQCALSSVRPTGGQINWPSYAIDEFRDLVHSFQEHSLTLYGEKSDTGMGNCYKIILWGLSIECEDALSPAEIQWNNINMILADAGLCHLTQKFTEIEKEVELETENIANDINAYLDNFDKQLIAGLSSSLSINVNVTNENVDCYQNNDIEFTDEFTPIEHWPKNEPIKKTNFIAIPTYVDHYGVIYLHEHDAKITIDRIAKILNEKYKNTTSDATPNTIWTVGDPCIAKYHGDKLYYRAKLINKLSEKRFIIEFVDYGNVEDCNPCDLRRNVILGYVPIQAHKYCLKDVEPTTPVWTTQILDIIHSKIVLKMCTIRTNGFSNEAEEMDVVPCQITVNGSDLSRFLVSQKYAQFKNENTKPALIYERFLTHRLQDKIYSNLPGGSTSNMIEQSTVDTLVTTPNDSNSDVIIMDSGEYNESNTEDIFSFNDSNFETSTQYFQMYEYAPFKMAEIQRDVHGLHGTVIKILSPVDIIISTKFEKLLTKYKQMMDTLQLKALTSESITNISIGLSCIAWNNIDNLWHRGIIKGYNQSNDLFTVLLVDKMDMIKVKATQIKKCPTGCQNYPLLYLRGILHKVKPNRRMRETDIVNKLSDLILGKTFYIKIVRITSQIPVIELYKDNKCENIVYKSIIDENFLTST